MAETMKLRLVRCPKCQNLLQELPDYSIYQCGGCGAVLRAKKGKLDGNFGSKRFDEERVGLVSDKFDNLSVKSENFLGKSAVFGAENTAGKVSDGDESSETIAQEIGNGSKPEIGKWNVEGENSSGNHVGSRNLGSKSDKRETLIENSSRFSRSGRFLECKMSDRGMEEQHGRMRREHFERGRFSSSNQFKEDTSSLNLESSYRNQASRSTRPEIADHEREELLRKLDELKDQLIRVQTMNGKAPEKTQLDPRTVGYHVESDGYFRDHPSSFHRVPSQLSSSNNHVARPPYLEHYHEPFPIINGSDVGTHNYPTSMHCLNRVHRYEEPFEPQTFTRPQARRIPSHHHRFMSLEPDPYEPHPYSVSLNQPSCSCPQCYARQPEVPRQIPPSAFNNQRFYHGYNVREVKNPPIGSHDPQPHSRKPSELKAEVGPVPRVRPQRVIFSKENRCFPIAGGTPFVTCHNCFKLLKLPKKMYFHNKGEWKMSCGACSSVISFAILDGKLVSMDTSTSRTKIDDLDSSNEVGNSQASRDNASFCSEDYANTVYDVQEMDRQRVSSSSCQEDISTSKSEEMHNCSVSSATTTITTNEDEHFRDELVARQGLTSTTLPREKADSPLSPPGSPPQDSFDYASKYRAINRGGKGSLSNRSDKERIMTNKSTLRGTSLKGSLASEMEIPLDEYEDAEVLQDSVDTCRVGDQQKGKKGVDSFLAGIIRKSFRDLSRSSTTTGSGKRNVTVNGHLISDRLVKKAEKLAGPIYPGKYWYDYRAGFWGVIGGPCLGIIPSNIQEFNYPMPEKCAGGNTGILVNGRELNQKDLDLLTSRGLPAARDKSYIIGITGRVVDAYSGKELVNLGKLAPTVEKLRCGFGMRAPEAAA